MKIKMGRQYKISRNGQQGSVYGGFADGELVTCVRLDEEDHIHYYQNEVGLFQYVSPEYIVSRSKK